MAAAARNESPSPSHTDAPATVAASSGITRTDMLRAAREIIRLEAVALWKVSNALGDAFADAVELIASRVVSQGHATGGGPAGSVIVTGMGKAGLIGQKIAATLASTGTRAHFLHPAEAFHGDLGRVAPSVDGAGDVVLMLTQSGETGEVTQLLPSLRSLGAPIVAVTASDQSTVGRAAAVVLPLGKLDEACSLGLAPSTSTTAMLAIGDALALVLSRQQGFRAEDFARYHPGGSLGRKLSGVEECMRPLAECRVTSVEQSTRAALVACSKPGRRTGAIMLVDADGRLAGLFTDSDLARLLEHADAANSLEQPIADVMCSAPTTIPAGAKMGDAIALLADRKFSELPVVDSSGRPLGLLDVTDIVGWQPEDRTEEKPAPSPTAGTPTIRVFPGEDVYAAG
ncbi:MAG: KpsF/GutQ family sugar-phosphate isomerase [Planctomycetota bacterium]